MVVVGQILSNTLSTLYNSCEDQLQVVELAEKIYHNSTLFLTAWEKTGKRLWQTDMLSITWLWILNDKNTTDSEPASILK